MSRVRPDPAAPPSTHRWRVPCLGADWAAGCRDDIVDHGREDTMRVSPSALELSYPLCRNFPRHTHIIAREIQINLKARPSDSCRYSSGGTGSPTCPPRHDRPLSAGQCLLDTRSCSACGIPLLIRANRIRVDEPPVRDRARLRPLIALLRRRYKSNPMAARASSTSHHRLQRRQPRSLIDPKAPSRNDQGQ